MHIAQIDVATGRCYAEVMGMSLPAPKTGKLFLDVTGQGVYGAFVGKQWKGASFIAAPVVPKRVISRDAFLDRFTMAEDIALDDYIVAQLAGYKILKYVQRRLARIDSVPLDAQWVGDLLAALVQRGILTQARADAIRG